MRAECRGVVFGCAFWMAERADRVVGASKVLQVDWDEFQGVRIMYMGCKKFHMQAKRMKTASHDIEKYD